MGTNKNSICYLPSYIVPTLEEPKTVTPNLTWRFSGPIFTLLKSNDIEDRCILNVLYLHAFFIYTSCLFYSSCLRFVSVLLNNIVFKVRT